MKTKSLILGIVIILILVILTFVLFRISMDRSDENISRIDRHIGEVFGE